MKLTRVFSIAASFVLTAAAHAQVFNFDWSGTAGAALPGQSYLVKATVTDNDTTDYGFALNLIEDNSTAIAPNQSVGTGQQQPPFRLTISATVSHNDALTHYYQAVANSYKGTTETSTVAVWLGDHAPTTSISLVTPGPLAPGQQYSVEVTADDQDSNLAAPAVYQMSGTQGTVIFSWPTQPDGTGHFDQSTPLNAGNTLHAPSTPGKFTLQSEVNDKVGMVGVSGSLDIYVVTPVTFSWTVGGPNKQFTYTGAAPNLAAAISSNPGGVAPALAYPGGSAPTTAGTYTVTVAPQDTSQYAGSTTLTYTIVPQSVTYSWTTGGPNKQFAYTGAAPNVAGAITSTPAGVATVYTYSVNPPPSASGGYTVTASPQDTTNYSGSTPLDYTIQAPATGAPPTVSINPSSGTITQGDSVTITWTVSNDPNHPTTKITASGDGISTGNGSTFENLTINSPSSSDRNRSITITGLGTGSHSYSVSATDDGGTTTPAPVSVQVDPGAVSVSITTSPASTASGPATTTVSWSSTNANSVSVTGDGAGINSTAASGSQQTLSLPASQYPYIFTITGTGASGSTSQTAAFQVGPPAKDPPTVTWTGLLQDAVPLNGTISIAATGHDRNGNLTSVKIYKDGALFQSATNSGTLDLTTSGSCSQGSAGTITFTAQAVDADNQTSATITHTVYVGAVAGDAPLPANAPVIAGTLDGQVTVDNHGAANYSIPLRVAPGRQGMEPKLSLAYDSSSGNGPLGIGWSLSTGFPHAITRGRTIYARDNIVRGVHFDSSDKYYLDGKRLLWTGGSAEGSAGSQYHTEVESFDAITGSGSGSAIDSFTVLTKDGLTLIFGKYNGSNDGYQCGAYDTNRDHIVTGGELDTLAYSYALKHVEDRLGNSIDFTYTTDNDGEYELSQIDYTANTALGIAAQARVRCVYNLNPVYNPDTGQSSVFRADMPTRYVAEREFPLRKRLDRVVLLNGGGTVMTGAYDLQYEYSPDNGPTRLKQVTAYLKDPVSQSLVKLNPTTFTWSAGSSTHRPLSYSSQSGATNGWAIPTHGSGADWFSFGDVDGDGKDDLLDFSSTDGVYVSKSDGTNFANRQLWPVASWNRLNGGVNHTPTIVKVCDINGDGKKDLVFGDARGGDLKLYIAISTGSGYSVTASGFTFSNEFVDPSGAGYDFLGKEGNAISARLCTGDFNGDGRDDVLIHRYDGKLTLLMSNGATFTTQGPRDVQANALSAQQDWDEQNWEPKFLGYTVIADFTVQMIPCDLNGDGLTDYAWVESTQRWGNSSSQQFGHGESVHGLKYIYAVTSQVDSGGNVTFSPKTLVTQGGWGASTYNPNVPYRYTSYLVETADVNGDGLTDFITTEPTTETAGPNSYMDMGHQVYLSMGSANSGAPIFKNIATVIPSTVHVGSSTGATVNTWFDKVSAGEWTGGSYRTLGTSGGWSDFDDRRNLFMVLGLSSAADSILLSDVNSDGMADFVWYSTESNQWLVLYSHGESYATTAETLPMGWAASAQASASGVFNQTSRTPIDLNGDGVPDFACADNVDYKASAGVSYVLVSSNDSTTARPGDALVSVTNGLGSTTTVTYAPITKDDIYTPGAAAITYPIRELRNATYVVSDIEKDTGGPLTAQFQYQYSGNELDLSGRGSLGFHSFVTLDTSTRIVKYQFLAQAFPMTGLAVREQTYRSWLDGTYTDFRTINSHDNTVVYDSLSGFGAASSPLFPFISTAIESRWEDSSAYTFRVASSAEPSSQPETAFTSIPSDVPYVKITATSKFDNAASVQTATQGTGQITNGNLTELATDYGDGTTETVTTHYYATPAGTNLSGLVWDKTTTVTSSYGSQTSPKTSFTYVNGNTPLVATMTVDGGAASGGDAGGTQTSTTSYGHDTRGRVTTTQISGKDLQYVGQGAVAAYTVSNNTTFDDTLDLPTTTLDVYGNPTTTTYDPIVGQPLTVTGPNVANDTTSYTYDALGRTVSVTDRFGQKTTTTFALTATPTVAKPTGLPAQDGAIAFDGTPAYSVHVAPDNKPATTTYYDRLGRAIRTVKDGFATATTDTIYNTLGQVVAVSIPYGPEKDWTMTHYDALGRPDSVTAPNSLTTTTTYNGLATTTTVSGDMDVPQQTTSTVVDAHGRTVKVWNADNLVTFSDAKGTTSTAPSVSFKLDGFGRMRETDLKDQAQVIAASYDSLGRQTELNDPDKGHWYYVNSALGQVLQQTDARGTVTRTTYDKAGRPLTRTAQESGGPLETANWNYYDTTVDPATHRVALGGNGWIGALEQESVATSGTAIGYATAHSANSTTHYYDAKGRPHIDLNNIDGTWFYTYTDYTEPNGTDLNRVNRVQYYWRPSVGTDPGRSQILAGSLAPYSWRSFGYTYSYDSKSYVLKIADTNPASRTWWQADVTAGYDELDRPVKVSKGGLLTTRTYRKSDGVLTNIVTTGGSTLQNFTYTYDELGNLKSRKDNAHATAPTETLGYDGLNRLTTDAEGTISYFPNGNIQSKPDVNRSNPPANFTYDLPQPHAVHTAWGYTLGYDANGNVNSRSKSGETWKFKYAGFDKPRWMTKVTGSTTVGSEFLYNADHSRVLHLEFDAADGATGEPTHYVRKRIYGLGSTLEADYQNNAAAGQTPDWQSKATRIYVPGPDGIVGTEEFTPSTTVQGGLTETAHIYHYDHLGSIQAITVLSDSSGNPAVTDPDNKTGLYSEDAWGARRNPLTWSGAPATTTDGGGSTSLTPRGFTGHEMLDDLGLVHMNGRIYDPLLGRFLSADLFVQDVGNLQAYNRYSYVWNNPLTRTDPSGWWNIWNPLTYGLPTQPGENSWSPTDSSAEWGATAQGAGGGAQIYANSLSMGATDALGVTNAGALANDSAYDGSRIAGGVGSTALMIATGGTAAEGSAAAKVIFAGMAAKAATDGAEQAGAGAAQIANDPKSAQGYVNVALGTVNMVGSVAGAKGIGDATAGVNSAAPKTGSASEVNPTTAPAAEGAACFTAGTEIKTAEGFVAIETIRVGDRVLTGGNSNETEVDPQTWRLVTLRLNGVGGDVFEIECVKPLGWVQENSLKPGSRVPFAVSEMGIDGDAEVVKVAACPTIASGPGRVVLMTVTHFNPTVLELTLAGLKKPLEPTAAHRLFSADRNDWVQAQELQVGEHLKTADGVVEITGIVRKLGVHRVYNIEVETEHRYLVSTLQVVSHNACAAGGKGGVVYKVSGENTPSGKPYVGRTSSPEGPPGRGSADGRNRTDAKIVDKYENTREGKIKEQKAMDANGGVKKLDNKRNEIDPKKRKEYGLD